MRPEKRWTILNIIMLIVLIGFAFVAIFSARTLANIPPYVRQEFRIIDIEERGDYVLLTLLDNNGNERLHLTERQDFEVGMRIGMNVPRQSQRSGGNRPTPIPMPMPIFLP